MTQSHQKIHKAFLLTNYILLGAASACIFLTLSLRLVPSLNGCLLILLHVITISAAVCGCTAMSSGSGRWYGAHMVATVLTAIFQGSVSILIFSRTDDFLTGLKSYVRVDDGVVILKLGGGLCILMFCLEWVVLGLAFMIKYYEIVESGADSNNGKYGGGVVTLGGKSGGRVHQEEDESYWPYPFKV